MFVSLCINHCMQAIVCAQTAIILFAVVYTGVSAPQLFVAHLSRALRCRLNTPLIRSTEHATGGDNDSKDCSAVRFMACWFDCKDSLLCACSITHWLDQCAAGAAALSIGDSWLGGCSKRPFFR